jgi:hypothetical protein
LYATQPASPCLPRSICAVEGRFLLYPGARLTAVARIRPGNSTAKAFGGEAKDHIGETATVCGNVVSTRYAASTKGQPTFINLDKPYPGQIFTVPIWGSNRSKFGTPEKDYRAKRICVTGKITEYRGVPEVVASDPHQLQIESGK